MSCVSCNKFTTSFNNICIKCSFDPTIVITYTDVKKKYKLTHDDLDGENLYSFNFIVHNNVGTKYLISEIETLAEKLTKDLHSDDKKRQAYLRQKSIMDEIRNNKNKIIEDKKRLLDDINALLPKYGIISCDVVSQQINLIVDDYFIKNNGSINMLEILDNINRYYQKYKGETERKTTIDDMIYKKINKKYVDKIKNHEIYQQYVKENKCTIDECFNVLFNKAKKLMEQDERYILINKWLDKEGIRDNKLIKNILSKFGDSEMRFNEIIVSIRKMIDKPKRIKIVNKMIKKITDDVVGLKSSMIYENYINGVTDLEIFKLEFDLFITQQKDREIFDQHQKIIKMHLDYVKSTIKNIIHKICGPYSYLLDPNKYKRLLTNVTDLPLARNMIRTDYEQIIKNNFNDEWSEWIIGANKKIYYTIHKCIDIDKILVQFCNNINTKICKISQCKYYQRRYIHHRCDQLGLEHQSRTEDNKRFITITKPDNWYLNDIHEIKRMYS